MMPPDFPLQADLFARTPVYAGLPGDIAVSFEMFPPKTDKGEAALLKAAGDLARLGPSFMSVTYGAGGSTRERSRATAVAIKAATGAPVAAHLTCVDASREETAEVAEQYWQSGIRHIVALRGDAPNADGSLSGKFVPHPAGHSCAADLVAALKKQHPFEISVAAYPEVHPDAASAEADLDNLKRKLDAGADRALTQFFFSSDAFFRFRDRAAAAGIDKPIVPGILPVSDIARTRMFAEQCGAHLPEWIVELFEGLDSGHAGTRDLVAATVNAEFCRRLYAGGVREFHFYTLNKSELAYSTCHLLGLRPKPGTAAEAAA